MNPRNVIIYGCGVSGMKTMNHSISCGENIIAFTDSDDKLWGTKYCDIDVVPISELIKLEYDIIRIGAFHHINEILKTLLIDLGISHNKIDSSYGEFSRNSLIFRKQFIYNLANLVYERNLAGSVAECGVYKGNTAVHINDAFFDRNFYLLDTFSGFDERDLACSPAVKINYFKPTSPSLCSGMDLVLNRLPNPQNAKFCIGYVPETLSQIPDEERFVFVNLDMDLYKPTKAALTFFMNKMVRGGVLLVHDYYNSNEFCAEIKRACDEFSASSGFSYFPLGDGMSVAFYNI